MKKTALVVLVLALSLTVYFMFFGCRKDVYVSAPATLTGDYTGYLYYQVGSTSPDSQAIAWRFTTTNYVFSLDTTKWSLENRRFCDAFGTYSLTDAVVLTQDPHWVPAVVCDSSKNPTSRYVILIHTDTHLKLTQAKAGGVTESIDLYLKQ